jgi:hypothetical protein
MVTWDDERKQLDRALGASLMLPWPELAEVCSDDLKLVPEDLAEAPDDVLIGWLVERGLTGEGFLADNPEASRFADLEAAERLVEEFGIQRWFAENIRRVIREEDPLPLELVVGGVGVDLTAGEDFPTVIAVASRYSDPEALAKKFLRTCRKTFGKEPFKDVSQHLSHGKIRKFTPEQMAAMHARGMSYKEIAIQSLSEELPDVLSRPDDFRDEVDGERERIVKVIRAARKLWKTRIREDSIG